MNQNGMNTDDLCYEKCGDELAYQGVAVGLYKDHIKLPNGKIVEWDLIKHPGGAAVLPLDEDGNVLLVEQYRNAAGRITLEIPAGKREKGEEFLTCATRELQEETGYCSKNIVFLTTSIPAIGYSDEVLGLFYAEQLEQREQHLDEDEFIHVKRIPLKQAVSMVMDGTIVDSKTVTAILMVARIKEI